MLRMLLVLLALNCITYADEPKAQVLGIVGTWKNGASGAPVRFGDRLSYDASVSCDKHGTLTVLFPDPKTPKPVSLKCEGPGQTQKLQTIHDENVSSLSKNIGEGFSRFFAMISVPLSKEPETYIAAVSRGVGEVELSESLLRLEGGRVDLGSALGESPAGKYPILFMPVDADTATATSIEVDWQPASPAIVPVPRQLAKRGIVKIAISDADGGYRSVAWALLEPGTAYKNEKAEFDTGVSIVEDWPGGENARASRSALRAYLRAIADQTQP